MDLKTSLILIAIGFVIEAWFSGSEIALVAANRLKLRHQADSGSRAAQMILQFLDRPDWLLAAVIFCHNLAFVSNVTLSTALLIYFYGEETGELLTLLLVSPTLLILAEMVPKSIFQEKADRIAPIAIYVVVVASRLFYPVIFILARIVSLFQRVLGAAEERRVPFVTKEELDLIIQTTGHEGEVEPEEKQMIHRIFSFADTTVEEAMVPLVQVVAAEETDTVEEVIQRMVETGVSSIPIYHEEVHNIVGIVSTFDLLYVKDRQRPVLAFMRLAHYVTENMRVDDLLKEMQQRRIHMAIVVDEYGGSVGIVTVEDLLEEVVGEIEDEFDPRRELYEQLPDGGYLIDARMEIDAINEQLGLEIPEGDYETLGGFVIHYLQRIPEEGKTFQYDDLLFTIASATNKRVEEVKINKPAEPESSKSLNGSDPTPRMASP
ncbi:MAG: HlyC/CorC family transporter [Candidatus Tectomicrobia bacterium]|uniref:HlyC/CorC family transporter n=1 Tax=Tectimicrobiota bacterium TaxID=2528274 RepID=A0A932CPQ3_UNCTE|nr:HlyC/CorC family transporter [Candidatus Tectomicrobia bacterium]